MSAALFPTDVFGWLWIGHAPGLASAVRREISNCDLVHIHELWHYPHWVATRIAWARGVPFIISPHGELSAWGLRQKAWAKRIYGAALLRPSLRRAHTLHALSEAEARQIRDYGVDARVVVVPNGVPPKILKTMRDKRAVRASFPQLRGKQVVLFLGRLHTQKGPDVLIEAWSQVHQQVPTAHLLIAGPADPQVDATLRARARELRLDSSITFTGPLFGSIKEAVLAGADLFVLPSRSEGQSVALLEAMAVGLPVVITPAANAPDVAAASAGLVSPLSPPDLARAMVQVLADDALASQLGNNGRALIEREFTWDHVAHSVAEMYAGVLAQRTTPSVTIGRN